jgi:hypothetical protein
MNFDFTDDQLAIREAVEALCADFGDDYWLARDRDGLWPSEFCDTVALPADLLGDPLRSVAPVADRNALGARLRLKRRAIPGRNASSSQSGVHSGSS